MTDLLYCFFSLWLHAYMANKVAYIKPVCDFLFVTGILCRTVSELLQLIVQILDTAFLSPPPPPLGGLRDNVRCSSWAHSKACSGLSINVNWTFFARCYGWVTTSEKRSEIGDFAPTLPLTVFTQRNTVTDFLQARCDFRRKSALLRFWTPFEGGGLRGNVRWSS